METCVSIIILSFNQMEYTANCLNSIRKYTSVPHEIIVIDNASSEETVQFLRTQKDIVLIENKENKGFAGACNQGIKIAKGRYIMLLNNDTLVTYNWLDHMVQFLDNHKEVSMTGPLTNSTVGKQMIPVPYHNEEEMQIYAKENACRTQKEWRTLRLVFFCTLIRRELFDEIGLLDEAFKIGNYEDDDFNIRCLLKKKKMYICRNSFVHHFMNISFDQNDMPKEKIKQTNKLLLEKKWDSMNWNHYADFNRYMLEQAVKGKGERVLHIGCGLGALEIELRESGRAFTMTGIEAHPVMREIAEQFVDNVYDWSDSVLEKIQHTKGSFDTIIMEMTLEKYGPSVLKTVRSMLSDQGIVLLRVFNADHITTEEKRRNGFVGGNLICAASEECQYHYTKAEIETLFLENGYRICECKEVKKRFTAVQNEIKAELTKQLAYHEEMEVYSRIYKLELEK